jgi:assimilatory nitrate reductase catalytic subunit
MIPVTNETKSTCPYCGVGCGVVIESRGNQITGVHGDPDHPANFGRLCTKGQSLHLTAAPQVNQQTRLLTPQWRPVRGQPPQALDWDAAMDMASQRLAAIVQNHGPDALGFYISGQLLTEDYYAFNKLAKGLLGTNNIDSNSRLCMSSAVAGYKMTLGADAPPACYDDIAQAQCLFIAGSNAAWAHPILFRRIEDAKRANPTLKMVVVDPRRTDTADMADLHLAIQPGTDVMLFHGLLHIMLAQAWTVPDYIAAHTSGFEALQARVAEYTPQQVAQICGVPEADLYTAARWFAGVQEGNEGSHRGGSERAPTLSLYCQGLNQSSSGTAKNAALINLHLATQQIGRPGAGPLSLTGQPNAMGGREVGGMANLMSAHRDLTNPQHRAEVAALWGVADVPAKPPPTGKSKPCGSPAPTRRSPCPTKPPCAAPCNALSSWWCKRLLPRPRPATGPTCFCPPPPGAKKKARSPTASAASAVCAPPCQPLAWPAPTGRLPPIWASAWLWRWAARKTLAC